MKENIVLIGMPSSGKTTVGKLIAAVLNMQFVDTDALIRSKYKKELPDIVKTYGRDFFLKAQESEILGLDISGSVIATGGGAVYSDISMKHLSTGGIIFYLDSDISDLQNRVDSTRRLSGKKGQGLYELYQERGPLYEKYSDHVIDCRNRKPIEISDQIVHIYKLDISKINN